MPGIISGFEYDIFISYRQKDNKYDGWVTNFVDNLKRELEATFKEEVNVYFDENPHDGLLEIHNVDASLKDKLKCLVFIPIVSRTYCDSKSYAWQNEFLVFNKIAQEDQFGRDIKLSSGNVTSRILPVKIHELDPEDKMLLEYEIKGPLRAIEFIYKEPGVNRPLKPTDSKYDNQNKTDYRNQINKAANTIKEIIISLQKPPSVKAKPSGFLEERGDKKKIKFKIKTRDIIIGILIIIIAIGGLLITNHAYSAKSSAEVYPKNITSNPKAYEWFMKSVFIHTREDKNDLDSAIFFLTKAIEADSLFALAHARLSIAYQQQSFWNEPDKGYLERAFLEAEKSLFLNPDLAEGYMAKAYCKWNIQNKFPHEIVVREFKKSLKLDPDAYEVYHLMGVVYLHIGLMKESFNAFKKAMRLNPDDEITSTDYISWYNFTAKETDLEHMIDLYKRTPEHHISGLRRTFWAIALLKLGRSEEAETMLSAALKKDSTNVSFNSAYAIILAKKGDRTGALKKIELCEKADPNFGHFHHVAYYLAEAYALLGDNEKSVKNLIWAEENGFPNYPYFRDDPLLESLHQYAPYKDLLYKLKIENDNFRRIARE